MIRYLWTVYIVREYVIVVGNSYMKVNMTVKCRSVSRV